MPTDMPPPTLGVGKALLAMGGLAVAICVFILIANLFGIKSLFTGFLFSLYWTGIKEGRQEEFLPSVVGALAGLATGWAMYLLPLQWGFAGQLLSLLLPLGAIFCLLRGLYGRVINMSYMLFLTVATIPAIVKDADFPGMIASAVLAALYLGGVMRLLRPKPAPMSV